MTVQNPNPDVWLDSGRLVAERRATIAPIRLDPFRAAQVIRTASDVRLAVGLSQSQMGARAARAVSRPRRIHRTTVAHYEAGDRTVKILDVGYLKVLEDEFRQAQPDRRFEIRVRIIGGKPTRWQVAVFAACGKCGQRNRVDSPEQTLCRTCVEI